MGEAVGSFMRKPKPTIGSLLRAALLSEPLAWAVQNATGVLFTILFKVVGRMSFSLGCVATCLYAAGCQVLSLDRTIGGRLFGAMLFLCCMLSAGILGGGISSLAWAAHGNAPFLMSYLPAAAQKIPDKTVLAHIQEYVPKVIALPLPKFVRDEIAPLIAEIDAIPQVPTAFWALVIVLYAIVSIPFAVGRASNDLRVGIMFAIATLFMGSQVVFAAMIPTLGLRLYWTQITGGYVKLALVNAGAMILTGVVFYAVSAHDQIRLQLGEALQNTGALLSHIASQTDAPWVGAAAEGSAKRPAGAPSEEDILAALRAEAHALAAAPPGTLADPNLGAPGGDIDGPEAALDGPRQVPCRSALDIGGDLHAIQDTFSSAMFEPPLPGLASQPGANRRKYLAVHAAIGKVVGVAALLAAAAPAIRGELAAMRSPSSDGKKEEEKNAAQAAQVQDAIVATLASCAAACAGLSVALRTMPVLQKCSGPSIAWRPRNAAFWGNCLGQLRAAAAFVPELLASDGDGALAVLAEGRSTPVMLAGCEVLLSLTQSLEAAAAAALELPVDDKPSADVTQAAGETDPNGKLHADEDTPATTSGVRGAAPAQPPASLKDRLMGNSYFASGMVLFVVGTGIPVWLVVVKSLVSMAKGCVACLRSPPEWRETLANRNVQYALKYWLGMALTIMGITLILWLGEGSGASAPANASNLNNFFFTWQPVYFFLTASICLQKQVEASAFRGILRAVMTAVGGVFGYMTMLNGNLANNPYFVTAIGCAFNALCGLFSPQKPLRYTLFLTSFTFNAVVYCQYYGCCDLAGDPKIFGGKVLSTLLGALYAIAVSWCIAPYYTSQVMLGLEAQALQNGVKLLREMHVDAGKAADGDPLAATARASPPSPDELEATELERTVAPISTLNLRKAIDTSIREPLGQVHKELEINTVDRNQLLLTSIILPTPPIVAVLVPRLAFLAVHLESADQLLRSTLWPGEPGPAQAALMAALLDHFNGILDAATGVADAAAAFMQASSKNKLMETRKVLVGAVSTLEAKRAELRTAYLTWKGPGWQGPDLRFLAWVHMVLVAVQDVQVIGLILSETAPALVRDRNFSWARSWCGGRPSA